MFLFIVCFMCAFGVSMSSRCDRSGSPTADYCYELVTEKNQDLFAYSRIISRGYLEICNGCNRTVCAQIGILSIGDRYHPVENICVTDHDAHAVFFGLHGMGYHHPIGYEIWNDRVIVTSRREQLSVVMPFDFELDKIDVQNSYFIVDFNENCLDLDFQDIKMTMQDCELVRTDREAAHDKMWRNVQLSTFGVLFVIVVASAIATYIVHRVSTDELRLEKGTEKRDSFPVMDVGAAKQQLEKDINSVGQMNAD